MATSRFRGWRTLSSFALLASGLVVAGGGGPASAAPTVFVNEIHYDNDGADTGEAIEIAGPAGTNLAGWTVALYNGSATQLNVYATINLSGVIPNQQAGFGTLSFAQAGIQNGSPDGLALVDAGNTVIEFLSYEGTFTAGDGPANGMTSTDIGVSEPGTTPVGNSLQLTGSGTTGEDFTWTAAQPNTFGAVNTSQTFGGAPADPVVVINEVDYDQAGTDAAEFVELKNVGTSVAQLDEFVLELVNGSGGGAVLYDSIALPAVSLSPGDYFVICANAATVENCDLDDGPDTNFIQNGAPDAVGLRHNGDLVDAVSYEGDAGAPYTEGSGTGLVDDPAVEALGIARFVDGVDTNQNNVDFSARCITPGATNASASEDCVLTIPTLVINEVDYDQPGTDAAEFLELKNTGSSAVDLTGLTVELINGSNASVYDTIALPAVSLAAGDYFVICANAATVANCDLDDGPDTNFLQNGAPDAVALSFDGSVVDAVSYEGDTAAPYTEGSGAGLEDDPNVADSGISRFVDGVDTDVNNVDFSARCITPGATNASASEDCALPTPTLVINEFSASTTGSPDVEFIEILGDPDTDYSAFTVIEIEGDSSKGNIDRAFALGTTDGSGFWTTSVGNLSIENGTITLLLVENFTGSVGNDIDGNDDGVIDNVPWTRIVDDVAVTDGGGGDLTYSSVVLGPNYDGVSSFAPGGASRIPDGTDTDTAADWTRNDFDLFGIPGFAGTPALGEAVNTPGAANEAITVITDPVGVCGDPATLIHDIQGPGLASGDVGNIREIEGVVVGDFQDVVGDDGDLNGFFVQEEDGQVDGDSMTSEGIFVFQGSNPTVDVTKGGVVRVRGSVTEFNGLTEINNVEAVLDCTTTDTATPATVILPVTSLDTFESVEGMAVDFPQELFASGNFTQGRFGEVDLSVGGPLDNPTNVAAPGAAANAVNAQNDLSRIQLDDGSTVQNPLPLPPYLGAGNTLRTGDSVGGVSAVMSYAFGAYELHPTAPVNFTRNNVRTGPPDVGGSLQVGAYNVLNYFTTLDDSGPICGPFGDQGCRGADNAFEFGQQKAKIVSAISTLDADVLGLMEIENHPGDVPTEDLVDGINAIAGPGTYDYITTGAIGIDAIRVALLYKPALVTPLGSYAILDSSVDPTFNDERNRPVLAQSFTENATGAVFTIAVNHLKSKGSPCDDIGDPDTGDEQGNCSQTRTTAALAQANWLAGDPTGSGSDHVIITGDLNAYAMEDPITTLEAAGYTDLVEAFVGSGYSDGAYSFNFFSESGYLDHALASPSLAAKTTGAAFWHVNADEPSGLNYNDFNQPLLFNPDEFRSSDHDPVLVGLDMATARGLKETARDELAAALPTGNWRNDRRINSAIKFIDISLADKLWTGPSTLDPRFGGLTFVFEAVAARQLTRVDLPVAQSAIDKLVAADLEIATVQIEIATDAGGNSKKIAKAQKYVDRAIRYADKGNYVGAISNFRRGWRQAIAATP